MEDKQEPIAIVGMSCRFGGDADTPKGFWDMLVEGESAWSKIPPSRWNASSYYHPSAEREGSVSICPILVTFDRWWLTTKVTTDSGFFLKEDLSKFDAAFFSMTAAEAAGTDPQQRKLLELAYEAFENGKCKRCLSCSCLC